VETAERTAVHDVIARQYRAALEMLRRAVAACPERLWLDAGCENRYWHVAYHALCCTHLYLQDSVEAFRPWEKHRKDYQFLGPAPWPPHGRANRDLPYSKDEVLEYLDLCRAEVEAKVPRVDLAAASGFFWLKFGKLELQFYSIRHIQHHTAQLADRLRNAAGIGVPWVGSLNAPDTAHGNP
jgi:hypothetical protein